MNESMQTILQCMQKYGDRLDEEMAVAFCGGPFQMIAGCGLFHFNI
jgi:hypothetical protein